VVQNAVQDGAETAAVATVPTILAVAAADHIGVIVSARALNNEQVVTNGGTVFRYSATDESWRRYRYKRRRRRPRGWWVHLANPARVATVSGKEGAVASRQAL